MGHTASHLLVSLGPCYLAQKMGGIDWLATLHIAQRPSRSAQPFSSHHALCAEVEREKECVCIVSHQAVLRALYGYFMNQPLDVSVTH